jgi:hypothetical protein
MNAAGIDYAILALSAPGTHVLKTEQAAGVATLSNERLADEGATRLRSLCPAWAGGRPRRPDFMPVRAPAVSRVRSIARPRNPRGGWVPLHSSSECAQSSEVVV